MSLRPGFDLSGGGDEGDTPGARFVKQLDRDRLRALKTSGAIQVGSLFQKAVTPIVAYPTGGPGIGSVQRVPEIQTPTPVTTMRAMLNVVATTASALQIVRLLSVTGTAAVAPETTQKAETTLQFENVTLPIETIAVWTLASKQVLADVQLLEQAIDTILLGQVRVAEENLFLNDATAGLLALVPVATVATSGIDAIAIAVGEVAAGGFVPTASS